MIIDPMSGTRSLHGHDRTRYESRIHFFVNAEMSKPMFHLPSDFSGWSDTLSIGSLPSPVSTECQLLCSARQDPATLLRQ